MKSNSFIISDLTLGLVITSTQFQIFLSLSAIISKVCRPRNRNCTLKNRWRNLDPRDTFLILFIIASLSNETSNGWFAISIVFQIFFINTQSLSATYLEVARYWWPPKPLCVCGLPILWDNSHKYSFVLLSS